MRIIRQILIVLAALWLAAAPLAAQDDTAAGADDNGFIIRLLQDQLSTETRKIRLSGVSGVLSREATVARITISDPDGVWLQIDGARIRWNRAALIRGRVEVEELAAERISIPRRPLPEPGLPDAEAKPFAIPELPVSVELGALDIQRVVFGEALFGLAAEVSVTGGLSIADGALTSQFAMTRLDGPGGNLELSADYSNAEQSLALDLSLREPPNGIVANAINLRGRPSVDLSLQGAGPLSALDIALTFGADDQQLLTGNLALRDAQGGGRAFEATLDGQLVPLLPPEFEPFFAGTAAVVAVGAQLPQGGLELTELQVETGGLNLRGTLRTAPDGFLRDLALVGRIGGRDGGRMILPVPGGATSLQSAEIDIRFGQGETWGGRIEVAGLQAGDIAVAEADITLDGRASNLDRPEARALTGTISGKATGITADDPDVAAAIGNRIDLASGFDWQVGQPLVLRETSLAGNGLAVTLEGMLDALVFDGSFSAQVQDLSPFSGLAGRALAGAVAVSATGTVAPLSGGFDLTLDGTARDLVLDDARADALLAGETTLGGRLARTVEGFTAEAFRLENDQIALTADGTYASDASDLSFAARLTDLALVAPGGSGAVAVSAGIDGPQSRLAVRAAVTIDEGSFDGRRLEALRIGFDGITRNGRDIAGSLAGIGTLDGAPIDISGDLRLDDRVRVLRGFTFGLGETSVQGTLGQGADGLVAGTVEIRSTDIAPAAALALTQAEGAIDARVILSRAAGQQRAAIAGAVGDLRLGEASLVAARIDLDILDVLGVPLVDGTVSAQGVRSGGFEIATLDATADRIDTRTGLALSATLAQGTEVDLAGVLENLRPGFRLTLERLALRDGTHAAVLQQPTSVTVRGEAITLAPLSLALGDGTLRAAGAIGETLDISLEMTDLPLDTADLVVPDLGITGQVSGSARITGPRGAPDVRFDLRAVALSALPLREAGLPPLDLVAQGQTEDGRLGLGAALTTGNGLAGRIDGSVPLGADAGNLDLTVAIDALPLALADRLAGGLGLQGRLTGRAEVTGPPSDPEVAFTIDGTGLSARATRDVGIGALTLAARGTYARQAVTLGALDLGGGGIALRASGRVPLSGPGLDVAFQGNAPLALANVLLAEQAIQMAGTANFSGTARGSLTAPNLTGTVQVADGTLVDPLRNLRVNNLVLDARLSGTTLTIARLSGQPARGGSVQATGTIGLAAGLPANLSIAVANVNYTDGERVTTTLSANLKVEGPLAADALVSGSIDIGKTEIAVPDRFGIREGVLLDIRHRNIPRDVKMTLDRAGLPERDGADGAAPSRPLRLDIRISAPNQIFIRGRGLDVEFGGSLRLRGNVGDLRPTGQFEMIRGRLNVLGQRIEFDEGTVTLFGGLDPRIRLVARSDAGDTIVIVTVEGPASDPQITFSSIPELPQDEVLALLLFKRNVAELTPFQIAQLGTAAATLAGGGNGGGLMDSLRSSIGLSNLDVVTGEDGNVGVTAGAYLRDNIYLDLTAQSDGNTQATVNIDITDSLRGRASFGTDGDSSVGIFFERDY